MDSSPSVGDRSSFVESNRSFARSSASGILWGAVLKMTGWLDYYLPMGGCCGQRDWLSELMVVLVGHYCIAVGYP